MKRAIISDIHGNLEALEAVFRDIDRRNDKGEKIGEILCLGDFLGYGPNPRECAEAVRRRCSVVLAGNHELGLLEKLRAPRLALNRTTGFGGLGAREGILWSIRQLFGDDRPVEKGDDAIREFLEKLRAPDYEQALARELCRRADLGGNFKMPLSRRLLKGEQEMVRELLEKMLTAPEVRPLLETFHERSRIRREGEAWVSWLSSLPTTARADGALLVHDNPYRPGDSRYLLDVTARAGVKSGSSAHPIEKLFSDFDWKDATLLLFGHSHFPGVYTDKSRPGVIAANPGSVGIPRTGKMEATYLIWNPSARALRHRARIVRVPLKDWERTGSKMERAGLPNKLKLARNEKPKELD